MSSWLRSRRAWAIIAIVAAIASLAAIPLAAAGRAAAQSGHKVAVVRLDGAIADSGGGFSLLGGASVTSSQVKNLLRRAEKTGARAVVLRINSPGGSVAASQEILAEIQRFRQKTELPVVVSMGDVAASGGYYISVGADEIVANPGTLTGSIGVVWEVLDLSGLYAKLGIQEHSISSGEHKEAFALGKITPESEAIIQKMSDEMHAAFIEAVAKGRKMDEAQVRNLATGQPFTGLQAKELELVDEIGGLDRAVDLAGELAGIDDPQAVEVASGRFLDVLLSGSGARGLLFALQARALGPELTALQGALDARSGPRY